MYLSMSLLLFASARSRPGASTARAAEAKAKCGATSTKQNVLLYAVVHCCVCVLCHQVQERFIFDRGCELSCWHLLSSAFRFLLEMRLVTPSFFLCRCQPEHLTLESIMRGSLVPQQHSTYEMRIRLVIARSSYWWLLLPWHPDLTSPSFNRFASTSQSKDCVRKQFEKKNFRCMSTCIVPFFLLAFISLCLDNTAGVLQLVTKLILLPQSAIAGFSTS